MTEEPIALDEALRLRRRRRGNGHAERADAPGDEADDLSRRYGRLKVYTLGDEAAELSRQYLIKGLINKGDCIFVFGKDGCGKTTLAQYLVLAIPQERSVFGRRVHRGRVLYLAFEGRDIFLKKMQVHEREFGTSRDISYLTQSLTLLDDGPHGQEVNSLIEAIKGERADLVICDTWSKMMAGADDNSHKDASAMIRVIDRIREETGAAVMILAHPNLTNNQGVSGSYTTRKDCDVLIRIEESEGVKVVDVLKHRDGEIGYAFSFKLHRVELGIDDDGDPITSVRLEEIVDEPKTRRGPTPRLSDFQALVLKDALNLLSDSDHTELGAVPREGMPGVMAVRRDVLRRELQRNGRLESKVSEPLTRKDVGKVRDALVALERKGVLCSTEELVWKP